MQPIARFLVVPGGIFLPGLVKSMYGRRTFLPDVTLSVLFGVM